MIKDEEMKDQGNMKWVAKGFWGPERLSCFWFRWKENGRRETMGRLALALEADLRRRHLRIGLSLKACLPDQYQPNPL